MSGKNDNINLQSYTNIAAMTFKNNLSFGSTNLMKSHSVAIHKLGLKNIFKIL